LFTVKSLGKKGRLKGRRRKWLKLHILKEAKAYSAKIFWHLQPKSEYLFKRLKEKLGEEALATILEKLYDLTIIKKEPPPKITKRLNTKAGRRSKVRKYLNTKNLQQASNLLEDPKEERISRRTYYRAKKLLTNSFQDNTDNTLFS
jgi:hypothetical protein